MSAGQEKRSLQPATWTMLWRGLTKACPICAQRSLFRWERMVEDCPRCGLHFNRIEGHWIGAIGINTIVSFGMLLLTVAVGLIVTFPDFPVRTLVILCVTVATLVPLLFYPSSKTLWTAIDLAMRPLEPHEVDPRIVLGSEPSRPDPESGYDDRTL